MLNILVNKYPEKNYLILHIIQICEQLDLQAWHMYIELLVINNSIS